MLIWASFENHWKICKSAKRKEKETIILTTHIFDDATFPTNSISHDILAINTLLVELPENGWDLKMATINYKLTKRTKLNCLKFNF